MIDEADRDGDGEVSPDEFERIMRVRPNSQQYDVVIKSCSGRRNMFGLRALLTDPAVANLQKTSLF